MTIIGLIVLTYLAYVAIVVLSMTVGCLAICSTWGVLAGIYRSVAEFKNPAKSIHEEFDRALDVLNEI